MPAGGSPLIASGDAACSHDDGSVEQLLGESSLAKAPFRWIALRRRGQRMVLVNGAPTPEIFDVLRRLNVVIGLALAAHEVEALQRLGGCGYILIGAQSRADVVFTDALRDLTRANWSIDHQPSLPVIVSRNATHGSIAQQRIASATVGHHERHGGGNTSWNTAHNSRGRSQ